jgi:membrane-associated phospholipid phosphatase
MITAMMGAGQWIEPEETPHVTGRARAWWLAGSAVLIGLTLLVLAGASASADKATLAWFTPLDKPGAVHVLWRVLVAGGQFWLVGSACIAVGAVRSWLWRSWRPVVVSTVAVVALDLLLLISKPLIGRTSPHSNLNDVLAGGTSYPSGHTAHATMSLALIAILGTTAQTTSRRRALLTAVLMAVVVGLCNLVLGYHWPSEVIAGWLLGGLLVVAAADQLARTPRRDPPGAPRSPR